MTDGQSHEVVFHRLAGKEYLKARRWYAKKSGEQSAQRFCDRLDEAVKQILKSDRFIERNSVG